MLTISKPTRCRLISGGPFMTALPNPDTNDTRHHHLYECMWFDVNLYLVREYIRRDALVEVGMSTVSQAGFIPS